MATDLIISTKARMLALAIAYADFNGTQATLPTQHKPTCTSASPSETPAWDMYGIKGLCHTILGAIETDPSQLHPQCLHGLLQQSRKELNLFHIMEMVQRILLQILNVDRNGALLSRSVLVCLAQSPSRLLRRILLQRLVMKLRQCVARMRDLSFQELDKMLYLLQSLHSVVFYAEIKLSALLQLRVVDDLQCCHEELEQLCHTADGTRFTLARIYVESVLETMYQKLNA